jgi:peptidoglycan biosynthesis protein MviN/MurJ (putative lipid II flippase)
MGGKYLEYLWLIKLSIAFQLIWQSGAMLGQIYLGAGYSKKPGIVAIIIGLLNVSISVILVRKFGIEGVVLGTILVGAFSVPFAMWWMLPDLEVRFKEYFVNIIFRTQFPLLIVGALLYPLTSWFNEINSWISLIISAGLISILLYLVGLKTVLDSNDKDRLKKLLLSPLNRK